MTSNSAIDILRSAYVGPKKMIVGKDLFRDYDEELDTIYRFGPARQSVFSAPPRWLAFKAAKVVRGDFDGYGVQYAEL